jgi:lipopolysaccharide/colanic/teichoic acid biosynthesis glycosyltransferase
MISATIFDRESGNNGAVAHCYYDHESDAWIAYGKSAYALRKMVKSAGYDNLRGYSYDFDSACSMVGNQTLEHLCQTNTTLERGEQYICIRSTAEFDVESYEEWVQRLKQERENKRQMWVDTHIGDQLSKNEFIRDGMSTFARRVKRTIDAICASICLVIFFPLFIITYICVRLEDGGPAIFKQERIGRFGRPFNIYKFRSMRVDAEKSGPTLSHGGGKQDDRLTKVGRFIRAHHIDELPQLWNVVKGDMAFVGPRPERKYYIDKIMEYDKRYPYLYQIRPGVTSYATLYNGYTDTMEKMLRRLEFDLYYLSNRSWWFDMKILFNTFCSIVFGKKF